MIDAFLSPMGATEAILCADGVAAHAGLGCKSGLTHHEVANQPGRRVMIQRAFHTRNINSVDTRYGVVATHSAGLPRNISVATCVGSCLDRR